MMKATIDRIEGNIAIVLVGDEGIKLDIPLSLLPADCRESDVLNLSIERDPEATSQAKERVSDLMEKLKKKSQGKAGIIQDPEG